MRILKGRLLSKIDKTEVDKFADVWEAPIRKLEARPTKDDADRFFRTYLRAHFTASRGEGEKFAGTYHHIVFEGITDHGPCLPDKAPEIKDFLDGDFRYYADLFFRLRQWGDDPKGEFIECYYNSTLNELDVADMLVLAACAVDDKSELAKVKAVSRACDRAYVMLHLNRAYSIGGFEELLYSLNPKLNGCPVDQIDALVNARDAGGDQRQTQDHCRLVVALWAV